MEAQRPTAKDGSAQTVEMLVQAMCSHSREAGGLTPWSAQDANTYCSMLEEAGLRGSEGVELCVLVRATQHNTRGGPLLYWLVCFVFMTLYLLLSSTSSPA